MTLRWSAFRGARGGRAPPLRLAQAASARRKHSRRTASLLPSGTTWLRAIFTSASSSMKALLTVQWIEYCSELIGLTLPGLGGGRREGTGSCIGATSRREVSAPAGATSRREVSAPAG